ncbi:uncharacterized protein LOC131959826 [Centropristis striata]|uniref:uncharacterized protein LOC131959826 n=1 Tax=Centropristis striata TaxID=184440 RepID=UPI0027E0BF06|nr:uncharacterized protein LOC131959826 [Centropristis striata]
MLSNEELDASLSSSCSAASEDTIILNFTMCDPPEEAAAAQGSQPKRPCHIMAESTVVAGTVTCPPSCCSFNSCHLLPRVGRDQGRGLQVSQIHKSFTDKVNDVQNLNNKQDIQAAEELLYASPPQNAAADITSQMGGNPSDGPLRNVAAVVWNPAVFNGAEDIVVVNDSQAGQASTSRPEAGRSQGKKENIPPIRQPKTSRSQVKRSDKPAGRPSSASRPAAVPPPAKKSKTAGRRSDASRPIANRPQGKRKRDKRPGHSGQEPSGVGKKFFF